ncbi:hypothetical protein D915_009632 [Fasciola hepatica]|uniref:Uncharacterized protein n=1 Tax=Fasciola hepatica TaxID=6192 RepID=A0A4E0QWV5_FASHE|nr:hypothetical protein D915_009632 [Fasciola hepatica]
MDRTLRFFTEPSRGKLCEPNPNNPVERYDVSGNQRSEDDIIDVIQKVKIWKSPGEDGVVPKIHNSCPWAVRATVHSVFFQSELENFCITPIFKRSDKIVYVCVCMCKLSKYQ